MKSLWYVVVEFLHLSTVLKTKNKKQTYQNLIEVPQKVRLFKRSSFGTVKVSYLDTPSQRFTKLIEDYNKTVEKEEDKLPLISLHGLRHTMATLLIAERTEISTVSGRLGHADISTTLDVYTHFLKERDTAAAATLEKALGW